MIQVKRLLIWINFLFLLFVISSCGFKEDGSEETDAVTVAIKEINRQIINDTARETDRLPFVSRSYNYAGFEYNDYISSLSHKTIVNALFDEFDNENASLVSYNISLDKEEITMNGKLIEDVITVGISFRGMIKLGSFMDMTIPTNTVFTGTIKSKKQLDFIEDNSDGMYRYIAEKTIYTEIIVYGGDAPEIFDFSYVPTESISPDQQLHVMGRIKRGNSYRIKVDWGFQEAGSNDLIEGTSFNASYSFYPSDGMMPAGRDSIYLQVAGCSVSLDIIIGFVVNIYEIPVIPLENQEAQ